MKIEFDDVKLEIPGSWKDIKLAEYEKWCTLKPETRFEMVQYVADICKIDADVLLQAPTQVFNAITKAIQFIFNQDFEPVNKCSIDGKDYLISFSDKLTLGEYVDVEDVFENDGENKLSGILAILCRPEGEKYDPDLTEERKNMFKNISCDKILPLISFFLLKKKKSDGILSHCLTVTDQANQFLKDIEISVINGDGIKRLPIWQRIRYRRLTKSLRKELSKFLDFFSTELINQEPMRNNINLKNK